MPSSCLCTTPGRRRRRHGEREGERGRSLAYRKSAERGERERKGKQQQQEEHQKRRRGETTESWVQQEAALNGAKQIVIPEIFSENPRENNNKRPNNCEKAKLLKADDAEDMIVIGEGVGGDMRMNLDSAHKSPS
ncbi:unnamed protein product [Sphagnum jensenii]|uniref:Uncharacterized protein n=1 Tax=Sphagnum jensenii TaxID=128206 RepID=A0ABP0XBL6_9BRYO